MKSIRRVTTVLLAVAVTGGAIAAGAQAAKAAPADDLKPALLTAEDLPLGFMPTAMATDADGDVSLGGSFPGCPALEPVTGKDSRSAAATFAKGFVGPYVTHAVVRLPGGEAAKALDNIASSVTSCKEFSQELAGITVRFSLTTTPVPADLGDRALGVRMTGRTDFGISVTADIVAVRRGELILWLNDTTVGTTPAGVALSLAQTAVTRCRQKVSGC